MKRLLLTCLFAIVWTIPASATVRFVADTGNATTNGVNLITAEIAAVCGDTITLVAGATYFGGHNNGVLLGDKSPCSVQTTVCTGNAGGCVTTNLPAYGSRVIPGLHAQYMAKVTSDNLAAFVIAYGAHHWTLQGLEITDSFGGTGNLWVTVNIEMGRANTSADLIAMGHFIIDRCFIHPSDISSTQLTNLPVGDSHSGTAINISGSNNIIIGNDIRGYGGYEPGNAPTRQQSYGIAPSVGGPLLIENNYVEAMFNNIFIVGVAVDPAHTATISNPTPTSATLSTVAGLNVGDIIALQYMGPSPTNCVVAPPTICYQTALIDSISGNNITYHGYAAGNLGAVHSPDNGGNAQWNGFLPHDITVTHNTFFKLFEWQSPPFANGSFGSAKGYIETKQCVNCRIEGNVSAGGCSGYNQETQGTGANNVSPWATLKNMTIRSNLMLANSDTWTIQGLDATNSSTSADGFLITNNFVQQMPAACPSANPTGQEYAMTAEYASNITYTHNTIRASSAQFARLVRGDSGTEPGGLQGQRDGALNFTFKDNIANYGYYGMLASSAGATTACQANNQSWQPNGPVTGSTNIIINNHIGGTNDNPATSYCGGGLSSQFPNGTVVANDAAVGFVNIAASDAGGDYHLAALASSSPYKGTASDGGDPGCNFAALDAALGPLAYGNVLGVPKGWLAGQ